MDFALNPALDATDLARRFAERGRVTITDLLVPGLATELQAQLRSRTDWRRVINSGAKLIELDRTVQAGMSAEQRQALDDAVYAGARGGFQYRYETIRVPDAAAERWASDDPLAAFADWWSNGAPRDFLRTVTGAAAIRFADAQATAFSPGDFLTAHDDDFAGKDRLVAYVLGLTPVWRVEWGGLLLFHDAAGGPVDGVSPQFDTLNLFRVPQMHSVSEVTRAAAYRRYSITGWLRA